MSKFLTGPKHAVFIYDEWQRWLLSLETQTIETINFA